MFCACRIPAHLRCTQCSILLHLIDICFLTCICLWQISQIQTFLFRVVGPGLVSTSPRFCEQQRQPSNGSAWPACPKNGRSGPHCWGQGGSTQFVHQLEFAVTALPLVGCVVWSQEGSSPVSLQLLRGGIWACMRGPCLCLCLVLEWGLCLSTEVCVVLC